MKQGCGGGGSHTLRIPTPARSKHPTVTSDGVPQNPVELHWLRPYMLFSRISEGKFHNHRILGKFCNNKDTSAFTEPEELNQAITF